MPEASTRILVDRTVIRLDGRPFFTFGPRVLLTPPERYLAVLQEIAQAGFTAVGSPPVSPGTTLLMDAFFDAADKTGLMVILMADPRLPFHGTYLAQAFRHRKSLHSYLIPPRPPTREGLEAFESERDSLRAQDLFHPICVPIHEEHHQKNWLLSQDVFAIACRHESPNAHRVQHQNPGRTVGQFSRALFPHPPRPVITTDLDAVTSDEERLLGLYGDDPWVSRFPPHALDWFPYLANMDHFPRRDLLGPQPEILRLQIYGALMAGVRGIIFNFFEALGGPLPFTGADRLAEASIIAQEVAILNDFFAEGQADDTEFETGHPRLGASIIRHGMEHLIVLRIEGYEEEYFVDEARMDRTEIELRWKGEGELTAWRLDFPEPRRLQIVKDSVGSLRILAGPLEMTGLLLLTPGRRRVADIARAMETRLPLVSRLEIKARSATLVKIALIEEQLMAINSGVNNRDRLKAATRLMEEATICHERRDYAGVLHRTRQAARFLRQIVKYQMVRALAMPLYERKGNRAILRSNYFTLPQFYRAGVLEMARAFTDLT